MFIYRCQLNAADHSEEVATGERRRTSKQIDLYSIAGVKIRRLMDAIQMPGEHEIKIDVSDLPAGLYYVRITDNSERTGGCKLLKY